MSRRKKTSGDCRKCNGFGVIYLPTSEWETIDGQEQLRWLYRKVKCAACWVQLQMERMA